LIVVTTGKKQWTAIIEAKIGKAELQTEQVELYLDLAKEHRIDAVITLSNQFAATPTHHPVMVKKNKLRSGSLSLIMDISHYRGCDVGKISWCNRS
jgi:hypothetical protein